MTDLRSLESQSWTVWLCPDCGLPAITPNAIEVYNVDRTCPGFEASTDQMHADAEPVEYVPRAVAERLTTALGLLRGYVKGDEGWKLINDALWLGARDENDDPVYPDRKATP